MQILPSRTISTLKSYDRNQPMRPWGLFNCFQGIGKGTPQLSSSQNWTLLVQSRHQSRVLSLVGAVPGPPRGSGRGLSSAGSPWPSPRASLQAQAAMARTRPQLSEHQQRFSRRCVGTVLTVWTSVSWLTPDVLQISVIFTCCESSCMGTASMSGRYNNASISVTAA